MTVNVTNCMFDTKYKNSDEMEYDFPYEQWQLNVVSNEAKIGQRFYCGSKERCFCGDQAAALVEALNVNNVENHLYIASHKVMHIVLSLPFMPANKHLYAEVDKFMNKIRNEKTDKSSNITSIFL